MARGGEGPGSGGRGPPFGAADPRHRRRLVSAAPDARSEVSALCWTDKSTARGRRRRVLVTGADPGLAATRVDVLVAAELGTRGGGRCSGLRFCATRGTRCRTADILALEQETAELLAEIFGVGQQWETTA